MARIRSIHPGLTSDEAYMSMSLAAKAGWTPLWMQCDDHGIFDWKPIVLKALIFPADAVDFGALLDEWLGLGCIMKIEVEGKPCGIVRNFAKFQKPKNPSYRYFKDTPLPPDYGRFTGIKDVTPPALPQSSGSPPEIPPQREEGGDSLKEGNGIGEGGKPAPAKASTGDGTKLNLDFSPSPESRKAIAEMGFGDPQFNGEYSKFKAYYVARGSKRADWDAQLISWFQRATPDPVTAAAPGLAVVNKVFVIHDSPGWRSWVDYIKRTRNITWSRTIELRDEETRRVRVGWWWPTEFPPGYDEATGERMAPKDEERVA